MSKPAEITDVTSSFAVKITMENFSTNQTPVDGTYLIRYTDKWLPKDSLIIAECLGGRFHVNGNELIKQERYVSGFIKMPISIGGAQ
ncbi:MAG TPA: hypothetical protein VIZ65_00325 [Cellvibrionaceae bacterium]